MATAGYSGTPLPKKLGIKPGSAVALLGAPRDFAKRTLGRLPEGVRLRSEAAIDATCPASASPDAGRAD